MHRRVFLEVAAATLGTPVRAHAQRRAHDERVDAAPSELGDCIGNAGRTVCCVVSRRLSAICTPAAVRWSRAIPVQCRLGRYARRWSHWRRRRAPVVEFIE
jgi:hypothetical protein